ncbi:RICIN domain-containing protein [Nonomuraea sp. NPDC049480]|uniref:RICIN domain-containing protein n=1 Tax=Nonomuraea sp. NPDC049480 TaxID=3364353 RepID=UPI0037AED916
MPIVQFFVSASELITAPSAKTFTDQEEWGIMINKPVRLGLFALLSILIFAVQPAAMGSASVDPIAPAPSGSQSLDEASGPLGDAIRAAREKSKKSGKAERVELDPYSATSPSYEYKYWYLQNLASGKCLDLENWGTGRYIQQYSCHGGSNQVWRVTYDAGNGWYEIKPWDRPNECADVENYGRGPWVQRYPCQLSDNQKWFFEVSSMQSGIRIRSAMAGYRCLDASDYGTGVRMQAYPCGYQANQWWLFAYIVL